MAFSNLALFNQVDKYVNRICKLIFRNFYVAFNKAPITISKPTKCKLKYKIVSRVVLTLAKT